MITVSTLALSALAAWLLISPHLTPEVAASFNLTSQLIDSKERTLQILRDTELDYATHKLSEADYLKIKNELSIELAKILERLDSQDAS